MILCKQGVRFDLIKPAGFRILGAVERASRALYFDVTITCGSEGHPPADPHSLGEAYDIRTHGLTLAQKHDLLEWVMRDLAGRIDLTPTDTGYTTPAFYGFLEAPETANEHIHIQRRRGTVYA